MLENHSLEQLFHTLFETIGIAYIVIFLFNIIRSHFKMTTKIASPIAGATLGISPGCAGAISSSTIYDQGQAKLGFLVAALIATMGDGAFILLGQNQQAFAIITTISFSIAIIVGFILNKLKITIPEDNVKKTKNFPTKKIYNTNHIFNLINRIAWITFTIISPFLVFMTIGHIFHLIPHHWSHSIWFEWLVIIVAILLITNAFVAHKLKLCKESCLISCETKNEAWSISKKSFDQLSHIITIITIALIGIEIISSYFNLSTLFKSQNNIYIAILISAAISALPGSTPQLLVLSLFLNGTLPFACLLASSIASSGDATFILFRKYKKTLFFITIINFTVGLITGIIYFWIFH